MSDRLGRLAVHKNTIKKMKKTLIAIFALGMMVAFSSCSTGRYVNNTINTMGNQTQVVLTNANFKIVRTVQTSITYKSNLVKFDKDQLQQSAYAALMKEANLQGSQALVNVTMENLQRVSCIGLFPKEDNVIIVTGQVIEFTK